MADEERKVMKEHYVSYEQAQALRRLGFDCGCDHYYFNDALINSCIRPHNYNKYQIPYYSAPRLDQAQTWLREVKNWQVQPMLNGVRSMYFVRGYEIVTNGMTIDIDRQYEHYEQALSAGIDAVLKFLVENFYEE